MALKTMWVAPGEGATVDELVKRLEWQRMSAVVDLRRTSLAIVGEGRLLPYDRQRAIEAIHRVRLGEEVAG